MDYDVRRGLGFAVAGVATFLIYALAQAATGDGPLMGIAVVLGFTALVLVLLGLVLIARGLLGSRSED